MAWHAQPYGFYARTSIEAKDNAVEIYNGFTRNGFTINAICGILGNIAVEGVYNPWCWQVQGGQPSASDVLSMSDVQLISTQSGHAYGLFQFDPAGSYIYDLTAQSYSGFGPNFSDHTGDVRDGNAQVELVAHNGTGGYIPSQSYNMTFTQYKESTQTPEYLALAWFYNFERGTGLLQERQENARYWYDLLPSIIPTETKKMSWIYYLKRRH